MASYLLVTALRALRAAAQRDAPRYVALISLPDELLQVLSAELDAAAACRLSQVDKAVQQWIRLHARERLGRRTCGRCAVCGQR